MAESPHTFHIPVMGTGFTIDSALRVAKYGISTVVPLVDDVLVEQVRQVHCEREGEDYVLIADSDPDARARRITAYLDLLDRLVQRQVEVLKQAPFEPDSDITRYFRLLPESPLKQSYQTMLDTADPQEKAKRQQELREHVVAGSIDTNIMAKLDCDLYQAGKKLPAEYADAMSAVRGIANSTVRGDLVLSAGLNPRLYGYLQTFDDFLPDEKGAFKKRIILKVSDYRSAMIQGRYLAKRGIWVSEYRVESGLNCGGHAFATKGHLMGPILAEFRAKRQDLLDDLFPVCRKALSKLGRDFPKPDSVSVTVQCGLTTAEENRLMLDHYKVDFTGWATPFLLVPEVAVVDADTVAKLIAATDDDLYLSDASPLDIPLWLLKNCESEQARLERIDQGIPGAPSCPKRYAQINSDFTKIPICISSRPYIKRKLEALSADDEHSPEQMAVLKEKAIGRACVCHELGGSVTHEYGIQPDMPSLICPGPNIVEFTRTYSLEEMVDHIYGRTVLVTREGRPHTFVRELQIYVDHIRKEIGLLSLGLSYHTADYFIEFRDNLLAGIDYYEELGDDLFGPAASDVIGDLHRLRSQIVELDMPAADEAAASAD